MIAEDAAPVLTPSSAISSSATALPAIGSETAWRSWRRIVFSPASPYSEPVFAWVAVVAFATGFSVTLARIESTTVL